MVRSTHTEKFASDRLATLRECPLWVKSGHSANVRFAPIADIREWLMRGCEWMNTPWEIERELQRPPPAGALRVVRRDAKEDGIASLS